MTNIPLHKLCEWNGLPLLEGEPLAFLQRAFERAKREILADMDAGIVPSDLRNSEHLSYYVEAPAERYGGLFTDEVEAEGVALFTPLSPRGDGYLLYMNARFILTQWIFEWMRDR